jgi:hypothetical protein
MSALLRNLSPGLHIWSKGCPRISILKYNIVRKWWNQSSISIWVGLNRLSRNMKVEMKAHIFGLLIFDTINIHKIWMNLFGLTP